jgi:hypothetical protein
MTALGNIHRPKLSRLLVHVLEDVPMNRLQVADIESPGKWIVDQLRDAVVGSACLEAL